MGWRCTCLRAGSAHVCGLVLHLFAVLFGPAYMGSRHEAADACWAAWAAGCLGCGVVRRLARSWAALVTCSGTSVVLCTLAPALLQATANPATATHALPAPACSLTRAWNDHLPPCCAQLTAMFCCSVFPSQFDESVDRMFAALRAGEGGAPRSSAGGSTPAGAATPGAPPAAGAAPALDAAALAAAVSAAGAGGAQSALAAGVAAAGGPQAAVAALQAAAGTAAAAGAAAEEAGEAGEEDEDMEGSALLMSEDEGVLLGPSDAEVAAAGAEGGGGSSSGAVKGSPEYQSGGPPGR